MYYFNHINRYLFNVHYTILICESLKSSTSVPICEYTLVTEQVTIGIS